MSIPDDVPHLHSDNSMSDISDLSNSLSKTQISSSGHVKPKTNVQISLNFSSLDHNNDRTNDNNNNNGNSSNSNDNKVSGKNHKNFEIGHMLKKLKKYKYSYALERKKTAGLVDAIAEKNIIIEYLQEIMKTGRSPHEWVVEYANRDRSGSILGDYSFGEILSSSSSRPLLVSDPPNHHKQYKPSTNWTVQSDNQGDSSNNSNKHKRMDEKFIDLSNSYEYSKVILMNTIKSNKVPANSEKTETNGNGNCIDIDDAIMFDLKVNGNQVINLIRDSQNVEVRTISKLKTLDKDGDRNNDCKNPLLFNQNVIPTSPPSDAKVHAPKKSSTPDVITQRYHSPYPSRLDNIFGSTRHDYSRRFDSDKNEDSRSYNNMDKGSNYWKQKYYSQQKRSKDKIENLTDQIAAIQGILKVQEEIEVVLENEVMDMRDVIAAQRLLLKDWVEIVSYQKSSYINLTQEIADYLKNYRRTRSQIVTNESDPMNGMESITCHTNHNDNQDGNEDSPSSKPEVHILSGVATTTTESNTEKTNSSDQDDIALQREGFLHTFDNNMITNHLNISKNNNKKESPLKPFSRNRKNFSQKTKESSTYNSNQSLSKLHMDKKINSQSIVDNRLLRQISSKPRNRSIINSNKTEKRKLGIEVDRILSEIVAEQQRQLEIQGHQPVVRHRKNVNI